MYWFWFDMLAEVLTWSGCVLFTEALEKVGRKADCATYYKQQMIDAGFVDVIEKKYIWPSNQWPKDKHLKEIGMSLL